MEELERIEHERQLEEDERRRQQEELEELERRRSQASLLSMTSNDLDLSDGPNSESTPRKSEDSGIGGYTDTAALLKEKLQQLSNNEDGQLEGIGKKRPAPAPPSQSTYTQDNVSLPPKRQTSDDGKSTTTGSYESEGSNEQL